MTLLRLLDMRSFNLVIPLLLKSPDFPRKSFGLRIYTMEIKKSKRKDEHDFSNIGKPIF